DTVNWFARVDHGGTILVKSQRDLVENGVALYHIQGDLGSTAGFRRLSAALAADPDVGSPTSDTLGVDADLGLVWVHGADSAYLGYLLLGGEPHHVRQISTSLGDEPTGQGDRYRLM